MPKKIGFIVTSSSGHEDNFSAKELMIHAPTANGWRSTRFCSYPQQVTLQLTERCRVRKLQLLAHQYMIAAKIEFHIGEHLPEAHPPGLCGVLRRLGYVSLSDNQKTAFKARELKSVHVDAVGTYLRVTFHSNHDNHYNIYHQVALVAINVLGESIDGSTINTIPSREQLMEQYLNSSQHETALDVTYMGKCDSISPLDDLAFAMYQDPEVAHIIRLLDDQKQDMVRRERYDLAKTLKQAIADLQKVGERLGRYDVEKHCAIEKEDYDTAKRKKEQMDEYRRSVYQQLEVHNLLDPAVFTSAAECSSEEEPPSLLPSPSRPPAPPKPRVSTETTRRERVKPERPVPESQQGDPGPKRSPSPTAPSVDVTYTLCDERPLPTLQRKERLGESPQSLAETSSLSPEPQGTPHSPGLPGQPEPQGTPHSPGLVGQPEPLTERVQVEASFPIEIYGDGLVAGAYSKTWSYREDALLAVCRKLSEVSMDTPREDVRNMLRAAVFLVKKALLDKVSSVFQASLKLLRMVLSQLVPEQGLGRVEVAHCLEQCWPNLLSRTGDPSSRLRGAAMAFIQDMALLKEVRALHVIPVELVKPFRSAFPARLALSRAQLLETLLAELGTQSSGFTHDNVMKFCTAALEHSSSVVRELAMRIIFSVYRQDRATVLSHLPPNNAATRKNILYRNLFDGLARMEGGPVGDQEKGKQTTQGPAQHRGPLNVGKAAAGQKVPPHKYSDQADSQSSAVTSLDNLCIFCGEKDASFTEDGLDLHYWKHCPMLRRCEQCRQVVEIASLTEHLLGECESRARYSQCPRCSEALPTDELLRHVQGPACNSPVPGKDSNHCPLCHNNFPPGEEAWKAHLLGRAGCRQNTRRAAWFQKTQPAQGNPFMALLPPPCPSEGKQTGRMQRLKDNRLVECSV
ncbi:centrosomal protein of 104 kDa [Aplochiton taeniatus]